MPIEHFFSPEVIEDISRRYLAGEATKTIVDDYGIHRVTFYKWIRIWGLPYRRPNLAHQGRKLKETIDGKRQCARCHEWKEVSQFSVNKTISDGLGTHCRSCHSIDYHKYKGNKFGITKKQYDEMLEVQKGVCAVCSQPESHVLAGKVKALAIDHNHITGKVRGLLCAECNTSLGNIKDSPSRALALYRYLIKHQI